MEARTGSVVSARPGRLNNRTVARLELASAAAGQGISPLELMLKRMRFYNDLADRELEKGDQADRNAIDSALKAANEAAKDAAPYVHARLSAVEHTGKDGGPVSVIKQILSKIDGKSRGLPDQSKILMEPHAPPNERLMTSNGATSDALQVPR